MNSNIPEKMVLIKSVHTFGAYQSNIVFTLNKATNEYEAFLKVPFTDETGKVYESPIKLIYGAVCVMMDKKSFIPESEFNSREVIEYKKQAINNLIEQIKEIK